MSHKDLEVRRQYNKDHGKIYRQTHHDQELARHRLYRQKNREQIKVSTRHYQQEHACEIAARMHHWYEETKEKRSAQHKHWLEANPDYYRHYYIEHREEGQAARRRNYKAHREERIAAQRRRRKANPDYGRHYRQENPEKDALHHARRKAHKLTVPDTLTRQQIICLLAIGRAVYPGEQLHLDHVVPLSKGGGTTLANTHYIPARLNGSKKDALPQDAYQQLTLCQP